MPTPTCTPRTTSGAPFALAANRPMSAPAESPLPSAVQVHAAALYRDQWPFLIRRGAAAARRRRGRPGQIRRVTLRCAAQATETAQPRACRETPKRYAERVLKLAEYEEGERQVHSARRLTTPAHSAPHPSPGSSARRMCRRRSPSELADPAGREATQHSHCNGRPRSAPRRALLHRRVEV